METTKTSGGTFVGEEIEFGYNWNNKLDCNSFTTIRLAGKKYKVGENYYISLKGFSKGTAQIVAIKPFYLRDINEYIARLDTGYSVEECKKLITTMYKNTVKDWDKQMLYLILLVKNKEEKTSNENTN